MNIIFGSYKIILQNRNINVKIFIWKDNYIMIINEYDENIVRKVDLCVRVIKCKMYTSKVK